MTEQKSGNVRRLGILTGGGDVPGLNAAIKAVTYRAAPLGIEMIGLRAGWEGITYLNRDASFESQVFDVNNDSTWQHGYLMPLNRINTRAIDRTGGTILHSTRTNPGKVLVADLPEHLRQFGAGHNAKDRIDLTDQVIANMDWLSLDGLIVIGGDDTLSFGAVLSERGVPVWGIPKTMDNDVPGTDYCIGFETAISRAAEFITRIRSTIGSHGQTALFRLFGRDAGFTAYETAIATAADRLLVPEVPANIDHLAELIREDRHNPSNYSMVVLSEGANLGVQVAEVGDADAYGHRKKENVAEFLADELGKRIPGVRFLPIDLTYLLRSGAPDAYDVRMAVTYANVAMNLVESGTHGLMVAHRDGEFISTDIPSKRFHARRLDPNLYDAEQYRPSFRQLGGRYVPQPTD